MRHQHTPASLYAAAIDLYRGEMDRRVALTCYSFAGLVGASVW